MAKKQKTANLPRRKPVPASAPKPARPRRGAAQSFALPSLPGWAQYGGPVALALTLVIASLLRGLYFRTDQLDVGVAILAIGGIALLVQRVRQGDTWQISFQDLAVLGFLVFSWVSILWAAEARQALQQAIVFSLGGVLYLYARSRGEGGMSDALLWALGGVGVASLLMAGAIWNFPAAVTVVDRFSGPFQYPDTAGAVYLALWFGATAAQFRTEQRIYGYIWGALAGLGAYLLILTLSLGAFLVAPLALLVLLAVSRRGQRIAMFVEIVILGVGAFLLAGKTFPYFHNVGAHHALLYGGVAVVLGAALAWAAVWLHERRLDRWQVALSALVVALVLGGGYMAYRAAHGLSLQGQVTAALSLPQGKDQLALRVSGSGSGTAQIVSLDRFGDQTTIAKETLSPGVDHWTAEIPTGSAGAQLLVQGQGSLRLESLSVNGQPESMLLARAVPQSIYKRLLGFSGTNLSVWERIDFWGDGMKMFAASPFVGWGGDAWQTIYQQYQSFNYSSTQAHSSVVDAMVSYGVFGLIFVLALAAGFVLALRRAWGKGDAAGVALVAGAAMWLHSLIDFDLSLAAVLLLVWVAFGAMPQVRAFALKAPGRVLPQAMGVLAGALAVWMAVLGVAAQTELALKQPTLTQLQSAASLDPISAQLQLQLATLELQQASSSPSASALRQAAVQNAANAYRLNRHSQAIATLEAQMQIDLGNVAGAIPILAIAQQDQPMLPNTYQNYLELTTALATRSLGQHQVAQAKGYLAEAWSMYEQFLRVGAQTQNVAPPNLQLPAATPQIQLYAGETAALLGKKGAAIPLLQSAASGGQPQASLWLAALGVGTAPAGQYVTEAQWLSEMGVQ